MPTLFEELAVGFADAGVRRAAVVASVHNLQFLEALDAAGVSIVAARSEIGAAYLADGHARIAREPTLVVTSTGPGAGNAVGAYSVAAKDGAAVVHVSTANDRRPAHALHDVPEQVEWMRAMGRGVHDVARTGIASLRSALAAREWPFAVIVPSEDRPGDAEDTGGRAGESPERASRVGGIDTEMLRPWLDASRRALWIGGGARGVDRARLVELAEASGAAVLTSVQGKDLFPAHHPQFVTCTLSDRELAEIAAEADVCLVLGSRLTELSCTGWVRPFPRRVIRVGYTDEVPAFEATETTILRADASDVVDALLEAFGAGRAARSEHGVAAGRSAAAACAGRDRGNLEHRYVDAIRNALEPGDTVVCDMTKLSFWTLGGLALPEGVRYLFPGLLSMGFGLPAALGASLAAPDSHVVAVIGDGSLASILSELDLAAGWQGRVSIVLSDDNGYGILRPSMNDEVGPVVCEFAGPRWDVLADACGAAYHEATDPDVLASVLAQRHTGVRIAHIDATDVGLGWRRATR